MHLFGRYVLLPNHVYIMVTSVYVKFEMVMFVCLRGYDHDLSR